MKQKISALMDGELFDDEAASCLVGLKPDSAARKDWAVYHLIGDAVRQPEHISADLSASVSVRMQDEPTVLAPRSYSVQKNPRYFALSAAATLAAVGVVAWMSLNINPEINLQSAAISQTAIRPANVQFQPSANAYLMAHQEFSPSTDMNGGASYIRAIAYNGDAK